MCPEVLEGLSWRDAGRSGKRGRQSSERRPFVSGHSHSEVGAKHCCFLSLPSIGTKADADSKVKEGTGVGNWGPQRCFCWGWGDPTGSGQGDREPTAACQPSACSEYHERVPPGSQASSRGVAKDSILLSSRDGYLLEPTKWPKVSQASCAPAACSFPGENARSWEALGEARPGQSSLSAGALR